MQEEVQKSSTTTLPLSAARVSGVEFSQPVAPASSGMSPSTFGAAELAFADIIAPAGASLEILPPVIAASPGSPVRLIEAAALIAGAALMASATFAVGLARLASATVTGFAMYSAGNTRLKFSTLGRSL